MAKQNNTKVVTGIVRLSYANVWEPKSINGGDPKYSCSIIIPKSDKETVDAINAAIDCAIKEGMTRMSRTMTATLTRKPCSPLYSRVTCGRWAGIGWSAATAPMQMMLLF